MIETCVWEGALCVERSMQYNSSLEDELYRHDQFQWRYLLSFAQMREVIALVRVIYD